MPIMTGKDAAKKIREYENSKRLNPCVIIILSANCSQTEILECKSLEGKIRADEFLKKPVFINEIRNVLKKHFVYFQRTL